MLRFFTLLGLLMMAAVACGQTAVPKTNLEATDEENFQALITAAGLSKDMSFNLAKSELLYIISQEQETLLQELEDTGLDVFSDYPYCIMPLAAIFNWYDIIKAESPSEVMPYLSMSLYIRDGLRNEIASRHSGSRAEWSAEESKAKCDLVEDEERATRGMGVISR